MKKVVLIFLVVLFFGGCTDEPSYEADACIRQCNKINREFVSFISSTMTCTCGEKIKKECN